MAPAAGAKFIGSVAPITLISHRFECQTRRFFAILRDGAARYGEGASGGAIDGAVTAQRIGRPDSAPAGGRGQGALASGGFFCLVLFDDTHQPNRKTKHSGRFLSSSEPWVGLVGSAWARKRGAARFPRCAGDLCGEGGGAIWRDLPLALGAGSGIVLRQQDRFGWRSRRCVRQAGRCLPSARL